MWVSNNRTKVDMDTFHVSFFQVHLITSLGIIYNYQLFNSSIFEPVLEPLNAGIDNIDEHFRVERKLSFLIFSYLFFFC